MLKKVILPNQSIWEEYRKKPKDKWVKKDESRSNLIGKINRNEKDNSGGKK
jgi:hypothetical protein